MLAEGNISGACEKLKESFALDAMSGTLLNLADCYEKDGKTATAWARFRNAASLAKSQGKLEQAAEANRRAKALESELSYITIVAPDATPGLEVRRNDLEVSPGMFGVAVPSDPGRVEIVASAPGYRTFRTTLELGTRRDKKSVTVPKLAPGDDASASSTPAPAAPKPVQASTVPSAEQSAAKPPEPVSSADNQATSAPLPTKATHAKMDLKPIIIGGVGAAALVTGGVFGFLAMKSDSDAKNLCPTRHNCSVSALDTADQRDQRALIADIGIGVGVVGIATAAVWFVLGSRNSAPEQHAGLMLHPAVQREGAGLWASGRF